MEFRKATQEDLLYVRQNPYEGAVKDYPYLEIPDDNCYAVIYESKLVAVGGVQVKWSGVGSFWLMLTEECKKFGVHGVAALLAIKDKTNHMIEKNGLWRAEAVIRVDFEKAIKMIEFLGFKRECRMEKYMPDKTDAFLYSRII